MTNNPTLKKGEGSHIMPFSPYIFNIGWIIILAILVVLSVAFFGIEVIQDKLFPAP